MNLSPNDIRNFEFAAQMRGYNREEVDNFLEQVAASMEVDKQENLKLSMEIDSLKTQLSGLREFEDTIKSAAIDARRNADMTIENAKQEAYLTLGKARAEAEQILGSHVQQLSEIEARIAKAELAKKSYLTQLRNLIESHLQMIDDIAESEPKHDKDNIEVTESSEVDRQKMETVATESGEPEPTTTEEANAADKIVPVAEPSPTSESQAPETAASDTEGTDSKPIDPELAAALKSYQSEDIADARPSQPDVPPAPGVLHETTTPAENPPSEFIVKPPDDKTDSATDKVDVPAPDHSAQPVAPAAGTDAPPIPENEQQPVDPEKLADELDKVAAKFEQEMDKAAGP